jgi:hypothetical protein
LAATAGAKILAAGNADDATIAAERGAVFALLVQRIGENDSARAVEALGLLRGLTDDLSAAKEALGRAVTSGNKELRYEASEGLVGLREAGVGPLIGLLRRGDAEAQGLALVQLGRIGASAKSAVPMIARLLVLAREAPQVTVWGTFVRMKVDAARPGSGVVVLAADALRAIGPEARESVDALIALVEAPGTDRFVRGACLRALGRIAPGDARVVAAAAMASARAPRDGDLREAAVLAAGLPARDTREGLAGALADLRSDDPVARKRGAQRLITSNALPPGVSAALGRAVDSRDFVVREGLALGIGRAWEEGRPIEAVLRTAAAEDREAVNRTYAKAALRALGVRP